MSAPPDWSAALRTLPAALQPIAAGIHGHGGRLPAADTARALEAGRLTLSQLMVSLLPLAATYARVPVSGFPVGAIVAGPGDAPNLYLGANVEFPGGALGFSIHAEQAAVNHAWLAGETEIDRLAVTAAPCGHCRQFLQELTSAANLEVAVDGQPSQALADLLPQAFGPEDLDVRARLMARTGIRLKVDARDDLAAAACSAAEASHAPYSRKQCGAALLLADGTTVAGRTAESAAYNPTLPALTSAWSAALLRAGPGAVPSVRRAALVEAAGETPVSQRALSTAILALIAPGVTLEYHEARRA